eukprot:6722678-Pyramimonas_sp.AAC.1
MSPWAPMQQKAPYIPSDAAARGHAARANPKQMTRPSPHASTVIASEKTRGMRAPHLLAD